MRVLLTSLIFLVSTSFAGPDHAHADKACMHGPIEQFGRYIGDWKIADEQLSQDGKSWSPGQGARWRFECIGDGLGVQDYWQPNDGGFGTNLRTYNPSTDTWEIVWAAKAQHGMKHITARLDDDDNIVMHFVKPQEPRPRRIIFFAPDDEGWDWSMQWSFDEGKTWVDVYRIRATPWAD